ncbi:MAG: FdhF/YdeP family oxidoreductase [Burkholderiaceae bacterium]|nr:MAG: FdhF/YdeP family oxidoreductase [Burkholderiaceae bacterium]
MKKSAGGWSAIAYSLKKARQAGGLFKMWQALRRPNVCKTCGLGMGGQSGGMVNEIGRFPSVCKKSIQAMAADMQGAIQPEFFAQYSLDALKAFSSRELEAMGRLAQPVYAGPDDTHYRTISWDEALEKVAAKLQATPPDESFFYFSGRSSNEAGFLLQLLARCYGSNHVNNCSYYCHQASGVALGRAVGSGTATLTLADVEQSDLLFIVGANPASNHPRLLHTILHMKRKGGKVIVVNPLKELGLVDFRVPSDVRSMLFGSKVADLYVQPHIGGDIAFFHGVAKMLLERGAVDADFIAAACEDWPVLRTQLESMAWSDLEHASGVTRAQMQQVTEIYMQSERAVFCWAMGMTHHAHGVDNLLALTNLALMRGMIGKPGAGLMPLRGHSNIQGMGSVGVVPELKPAMLERLQARTGIALPQMQGLDTMGCMQRAAEGRMRFGWCLGGNLFGSNPDRDFSAQALSQVDLMLYLNTTLNTGHTWGRGRETLILPVLARDEEAQATTQESMFNRVRLSTGGPRRLDGPRSEVEIIATLAQCILSSTAGLDWHKLADHAEIRQLIAAVVPGYADMKSMDSTQGEFTVAGRVFHTPRFPTPSGKARFHAVMLPPARASVANQLCMMTIRSEGQFNTVVYEDEDLYRGQERRDVILMHRDDRMRLGLDIDQQVNVSTATGTLRNIRVREFDIRPGNAAMYYPEANVLIPRSLDPASRTPAFKQVWVTIAPAAPLPRVIKLAARAV